MIPGKIQLTSSQIKELKNINPLIQQTKVQSLPLSNKR